jgi:gliding motility-associated-like protein
VIYGVPTRYRELDADGNPIFEDKDPYTDPYELGYTYIRWTFTDKSGNDTFCVQPINVIDTIVPVFDCATLSDIDHPLESDECSMSKADVLDLLGSQIAKDNCGGEIPGYPYLQVAKGDPLKSSYSKLEYPYFIDLPDVFLKDTTYKIVWIFEDDADNVVQCSQNLILRDVTKPDISEKCPENGKEIDVFATEDCSVGFDAFGLPTIEDMMISDKCDGDIYPELWVYYCKWIEEKGAVYDSVVKIKDGKDNISGMLFDVTKDGYPHYVRYIYEDKIGNRDTCLFAVNVIDSIAPVVECNDQSPIQLFPKKGECAVTWEDVLEPVFTRPSAEDACAALLLEPSLIEPTLNRYFVKCSEYEDGVCVKYDTTFVSNSEKDSVYRVGLTLLEYVFTDTRGNSDTCVMSVTVATDIQCPNDTIRPLSDLEKCSVKFESVYEILKDKKSYAVDICTGDSVLGEWTGRNGSFLPSNDFEFEIGGTYVGIVDLKIPLVSGDKFCPVVIIPSHQNSLVPACVIDSLSDFVVTAKEGECEAEAGAAASIPVPTATDPCTNDVVNGVPFIFEEVDGVKDTVAVDFATKVFPTGTTTIHWQFVSPLNLTDTVWCEQDVLVKGNKKFDLDCETLTPMRRDTIDDCGVTDPTEFVIDTPMVEDPCVKDENGNPVVISGVPVRSDKMEMSEGFSLGETKIMWIFTDVTGAINDTCFQTIEVRTSLDMIIECDSIDSVVVAVEEGQCTVEASQVELPTPFALHPCLLDENGDSIKIWGVPTRSDGNLLDAPYYVGKTTITWTFIDTTETLVNEVKTCTSNVFVGDVNEVPVECKNFPDAVVVLPEDKCELSWTNFNFEVKPVVDLCTREIVDPVVTIKSTGEKIDYKTFFVLEDGSEVEELTELQSAKDTVVRLLSEGISFGLGADTIVWEYDFKGSVFTCEQRISVKNKVAPSGGCENVPDELTFQAPTGVCEMSSSMVMDSLLAALNPWPVAYDHCDTNKENPINGKVYYDGQEITSTSKFDMPVGKNIVTWVFIDTAINIVGDTCEKTIIIQSDLAPVFDCESLETLNFETDDCEYTYEWNDENTPTAKDACTGEDVKGVGTRSDGKDLNAPYPVGETVITWEFVSPYSTAVHSCPQSVWVRTTAQPLFKCESLDTIKLTTPEGVCEVDAFGYLNENTKPVAEDSCTGVKIEGVPLTKDSVAFVDTNKFVVGDTTKIIWKFFNDSLNVNPKYCDQYVLVTGSNKPLFICDTLRAHDTEFEIAGCDTILGPDALPVPVALDSCTKDSVWGVGVRSDGKELSDPFPVGTTVITWTFKSPYSNVPAICDQEVVVLTTQEIDFDCEVLDTIVIPVADINICDVEGVELDGQFAKHPCPEQSGVTRIVGVPFVNNATVITPNADSTKWTIEKVHVGRHTITWTFTDPSDPATMQNPTKTCKQVLQVGEGTNASVDCENFPDTTFRLSPDDCAITWTEMDMNIAPVVDLCADTLLIPVVSRSSGKAISAVLSPDSTKMIITAEDFTVGVDTIKWEFESIGAECEQVIIVKDSTAPEFDCENFEPEHLTLSAPTGTCEIVASEVYDSLAAMFEPWPTAIEYCTKEEIPGRVFIDDANNPDNEIKKGSALKISVGDHKLVWVFIDTLINEIGDTCVKDFTLMSDLAPVFECSELTDITFNIEGCNTTELTDADIPTPVATDACVEDKEIPAVGVRLNPDGTVQVGANGDTLSVLGVYPVGTTVIRWTFVSPFSKIEKVCYQKIVVLSEQKLDFDCEILSKETIRIPLDPTTELSNPESATSKLDTLHANHPCPVESGVEFVMGVPSIEGKDKFVLSADSLKWTIPALPADTYTIVWTFTDTTGTLVEPIKVCTQDLIVEDVIDTLTCPPGRNMTTVACESELPDTFKTFDEFISAGGSITDHNDFDKNSFGYKEFSEGQKYCDEMRRIMYYVLDVRKDTVACIDTFFIKDTIAPLFVGDLKPLTVTCDQDVPDLLKPAVDDCDPEVVITSERSSSQGDDPNKCDYYSYVVTYKWIATDRCGNVSDTTQVINVVDTIAPKVTLPSNWADTVLSIYEKGCVFRVPDFTEDLRDEDVIRDNCTPIGSVIITQTPQGGDTIYQTTKILITISDPCGSDTVVEKWVYAPVREAVVELTSTDTVSCVSDDAPISLMDLSLRYAVGSYKEFDDWTGEYYEKSSSFQWDIYRGKVHKDSLVYSNNKYTHAGEFKHLSSDEAKKLYQLTRQKNSGTYWFVAADTATMCTDTSSSVITLKERPRVSVTTGVEEVCENTLMDSAKIYTYFDCVADMGAPIIKEGWMYGDSLYNFSNSKFVLLENSASFIYYAENECGASTSMDSYKYFCGLDSLTKEDSIFFVGPDDYPALKEDKLVVDGHVTINVHQRFDPLGITITTEPHDPARIWLGELVELQAHTNYKFAELKWYRVVGEYDRRNVVQGENQFEFEFDDSEDEQDIELGSMSLSDSWIITDTPEDTARYYVTISDMVCPSVASELTQVNVILKIPTAFTPYEIDGYNDIFMERHALTIFDRYGQKVFEGDNGWNGTKGGKLADPGVYFYVVTMTDGSQRKGTIEVVYLND